MVTSLYFTLEIKKKEYGHTTEVDAHPLAGQCRELPPLLAM